MNVAISILIYAGTTIIACAMIAAAVSFSSPRARQAMRDETLTSPVENSPSQPQRRIVFISQRFDRHIYYIGILIALWFAGVGIITVPIGTGALATLAESTQKLLAFAMILGSSLSLLGASLGPPRHKRRPMRWWFPDFQESYAYGIGAGGQFCIGVALGFFGWTVLTNGTLIGGVTGLITPILSVCAFRLGRQLWSAHRRLDTQWWDLKRAAEGED